MTDRLTEAEIEIIVERTVKKTLLTMGIDTSNPMETQRDFKSLRDWRRSSEAMQTYGFRTAISILVAGILGAIWLGLQNAFGK